MVCYAKTTKRDTEHRIWYGVAALEHGAVAERIDELTTDGQAVDELIDRLNRGHASRIHLADIIDDFMARLSYR